MKRDCKRVDQIQQHMMKQLADGEEKIEITPEEAIDAVFLPEVIKATMKKLEEIQG